MVVETWISVNAAALNVHEAAHDLEGLNDEICGGAGMVEEEVELDVVERTLGGVFGSWGAVQEVTEFFHGRRVAGGGEFGQWADVSVGRRGWLATSGGED